MTINRLDRISKEKTIVVGVRLTHETWDDAEANTTELEKLLETAGGERVATLILYLRSPSPHAYLGKGKIEEIRDLVAEHQADLVLIEGQLTGSQIRNLEEDLQCRVVDRTEIILDIFALHAHTDIGKVQVELAQLMHHKTKLRVHAGTLSKLGGGIGTRGPGETKLEVDRRRIDDRISILRRRLDKLRGQQEVQRKLRLDPKIQHIAIVGYTNVGKSSLLNVLTRAGVLVEDKLFATLDTTTRKLVLPCGRHVVLTDTVGFIRKLPHEIVEAFHSTFHEAREADLILHLVDSSGPNSRAELDIGNEILEKMDVHDIPKLYVLTKKDLCGKRIGILAKAPAPHVAVSSLTHEGLDDLLEAISLMLELNFEQVKFRFPPEAMDRAYQVRKHGRIIREHPLDGHMEVEAMVPGWLSGTLRTYLT